MLFAFFLVIEVVWFSYDSFQRQQLLEILGRDDLAREIQLDPYYPIMPQLWLMRLDDHNRAINETPQERAENSKDNAIRDSSTNKSSDKLNRESLEEQVAGWQASGQHYATKMLCRKPKIQNLDNVQ